jgi:hypothetical protein
MQMTEAQDLAVQAIIAAAPARFERIVADIEILEEASGYAMDTVCFAIVRDASGDLVDPSVTLEKPARQAVIDLYKAVRASRPDAVPGTIEIAVEGDGRYAIQYDYAAPTRLNGEWNEAKEQKLDSYLARYREEQATAGR